MRSEWIYRGGEFQRGPWELAHRERIISVEKTSWAPKDTLLLPGFINLHCHLELTSVSEKSGRDLDFTQWVKNLRSEISSWTQEQYVTSVKKGLAQLTASGVTSVVDVGNTSANWQVREDTPIRLWAQRELLGLDPTLSLERFREARKELEGLASHEKFFPDLTAHAPYSCSIELLNALSEFRRLRTSPLELNLHVEESNAEKEFFCKGEGELRKFAQNIYPSLNWSLKKGGADHLLSMRPELKNELWVHGNTLSEQDLCEVSRRHIALVHCPKSRAYFNHPEPDLKSWSALGIKWGIGTDSAASNEGLDFWSEIQQLVNYSGVSVKEAIYRSTEGAADILELSDLGRLEKNCWADFQLVRLEGDLEEGIKRGPEVIEVFCQGHRVYKKGDE